MTIKNIKHFHMGKHIRQNHCMSDLFLLFILPTNLYTLLFDA